MEDIFGDNDFAEQLERDKLRTKDDDSLTANYEGDPAPLFDKNPRLLFDPLEYTPKKKKNLKNIKEEPDKLQRQKAIIEAVTLMTACGISQTSQGVLLGLSQQYLGRIYKKEIEYGKDIIIARVANAMLQKALDGNVTAGQFILKSKGGWKEPTQLELSGADGAPLISGIEREQRLMRIMMQNPEVRKKLESKREVVDVEVVDEKPLDDIF